MDLKSKNTKIEVIYDKKQHKQFATSQFMRLIYDGVINEFGMNVVIKNEDDESVEFPSTRSFERAISNIYALNYNKSSEKLFQEAVEKIEKEVLNLTYITYNEFMTKDGEDDFELNNRFIIYMNNDGFAYFNLMRLIEG